MKPSKPIPRPDEAALRAAYEREVPHRPHWPRSFEAAIADPLTAQILRLMATHPPSFGRRKPQRPPPSHPWRFQIKPKTTGSEIDFKSRAAGEKPEPDET